MRFEALEGAIEQVPGHLTVCLFHSATAAYFTDSQCAAFTSTIDRSARSARCTGFRLKAVRCNHLARGCHLTGYFVRVRAIAQQISFGLLGHASWRDGHRTDELLARVDMHGRWLEWLEVSSANRN